MYYLIIKNLGVEKCIDMNKKDIYKDNASYNCQSSLPFVKKRFIRKIQIACTGFSASLLDAEVYSD